MAAPFPFAIPLYNDVPIFAYSPFAMRRSAAAVLTFPLHCLPLFLSCRLTRADFSDDDDEMNPLYYRI